MSPQDWVLSVCQWVFIVALLPSIFGPRKPAMATSLITGGTLAAMAVTYATLELWIATASTAAVSVGWFVLAAQVVTLNRRRAYSRNRMYGSPRR